MRIRANRLLFAGIFLLVSGVLIAAWGHYVTATCGYDCGIFSVTTGPAAVVFTIASFALIIASWVTLFLWFVSATNSLRKQ